MPIPFQKCCGTCKYWIVSEIKTKGKCKLNAKDRGILEMVNCLGWKPSNPWDIENRGFELEPQKQG